MCILIYKRDKNSKKKFVPKKTAKQYIIFIQTKLVSYVIAHFKKPYNLITFVKLIRFFHQYFIKGKYRLTTVLIFLKYIFVSYLTSMKTGRRAHRGHSTPTEAFESTTNTRSRIQRQLTVCWCTLFSLLRLVRWA